MFYSSTISRRTARLLDRVELGVTVVLFIEILLRFVSDWRAFHRNKRNWVDLLLATMTCIILIPSVKNSGRAYAWLTIFQILRVYRLVWAIPVIRILLVSNPVRSSIFAWHSDFEFCRLKCWATFPAYPT